MPDKTNVMTHRVRITINPKKYDRFLKGLEKAISDLMNAAEKLEAFGATVTFSFDTKGCQKMAKKIIDNSIVTKTLKRA